jgi:superfamily II DNA/RNA helicase
MAVMLAQVNKVRFCLCIIVTLVFEIKQKKPQVLVATPGRLIDLCQNFGLNISNCNY